MATKSESKTSKTKTKSTTSAKTASSKAASAKAACSSTSTSSVTFEYFAPEARQVILAGSFNNWNTQEVTLKKEKSGRWKVELDLTPGRYEYKYLVDGSWQNDQKPVACVRNPYGSSNSVVEVSK